MNIGDKVIIKGCGPRRSYLNIMIGMTGKISKIFPYDLYEVIIDDSEQAQKVLGYHRHFDLQESELELIVEKKEVNLEELPKHSDVEQAFLDKIKTTYNKCPSCDEVCVDGDEVTLYECQNCGTVFSRESSADGDSHRCPDCQKFASKLTEKGCPTCEGSEELEIINGYYCDECDQYFEDEVDALVHFHEYHMV
jgi:predicted RNA-binding Zn-ribbon protein involved in translation (DUF1610 family)